MTKIILILLLALVFEASGVVFLSLGMKRIGPIQEVSAAEIGRIVRSGVRNPHLWIGVWLEAIFFLGLLYLMSLGDISLIWPLTSLGFVLTTLAGKFILNEQITATRWSGVLLIMIGAMLVTRGEKTTPPEPEPAPVKAAP